MSGALSGRRILLVDDDMLVVWALEDMLKKLQCVVVGPAANVDQALAMVKSEPDAAVLDINLNGVLSYPVADALSACAIPFLFATAYSKERLQGDYLATPVLQKPFQRTQLREALTNMIRTRTTARCDLQMSGDAV